MDSGFLAAMLQSVNQKGQGVANSYIQQQQQQQQMKQQSFADFLKQKQELVKSGKYVPKEGVSLDDALMGRGEIQPVTKTPGLLFLDPVKQVVYRGAAKPGNEVDQSTLTEDDKKNLITIPAATGGGAAQSAKMLEVQSSLITRFNADPSTKKSQQSMDAAGDIINLANSGNPIAASAIPTYSARMSGEVGNLSEADKKPFGGSQAISARIAASLQQMKKGTLTEENRAYIVSLSELIKTRATEKMDALARIRAEQYGKLKDKPFGTAEEIYNTLRPTIEAIKQPAKGSGADPAIPASGPANPLKSKYGLE